MHDSGSRKIMKYEVERQKERERKRGGKREERGNMTI
jgi:hypothetical protein